MVRLGLLSLATGVVAILLVMIPPFGPVGPCATNPQSFLLMVAVSALPLGTLVLFVGAVERLAVRIRKPRPPLSIIR